MIFFGFCSLFWAFGTLFRLRALPWSCDAHSYCRLDWREFGGNDIRNGEKVVERNLAMWSENV